MTNPTRPLGFYLKMMAIAYVVWALYFVSSGHLLATILQPADLTSAWDAAIPFMPWTVWIYSFCYVIPLVAVFALTDGHQLNRLLVAIYTATISASVVYFLVPIAYPDPEFGTSLSGRFLAFQFAIDFKPGANKMPSLHVANSFLVWFAIRKKGRNWSASILTLATLIAISTLTTKRHLIGDVALGTLWAIGAWWISGILYQRFFDQTLSGREALLSRLGLLRSGTP